MPNESALKNEVAMLAFGRSKKTLKYANLLSLWPGCLDAFCAELEQDYSPEQAQGSGRTYFAPNGTDDAGIRSVAVCAIGLFGITSQKNIAHLWDMPTGQRIGQLPEFCAEIKQILIGPNNQYAAFALADNSIQVWDLHKDRIFWDAKEATVLATSFAWGAVGAVLLSGHADGSLRCWDTTNGRCIWKKDAHTSPISALACHGDVVLTGSGDNKLYLYDLQNGQLLRDLSDCMGTVNHLCISKNESFAASASKDNSIRFWNLNTGICIWEKQACSVTVSHLTFNQDDTALICIDWHGAIERWELGDLRQAGFHKCENPLSIAKVIIVGNSGAGKTSMARYLAGLPPQVSESTQGVVCVPLQLSQSERLQDPERNIWLQDFGGQADQRMIHQLSVDHAALVILMFDAQAEIEAAITAIQQWESWLGHVVSSGTPKLLVAGRAEFGCGLGNHRLQEFASAHGFANYLETSVIDGRGCLALRSAILEEIDWQTLISHTSFSSYTDVKEAIHGLREQGRVALTVEQLYDYYQGVDTHLKCDMKQFRGILDLLAKQPDFSQLSFDDYVLLQPEWIEKYALAITHSIESDPKKLGCLQRRRVTVAELDFFLTGPNGEKLPFTRLLGEQERIVLLEMERLLLKRKICLEQGGDLIFPGHLGVGSPKIHSNIAVWLSYQIEGYLEGVYTCLVVTLAQSGSFELTQLWCDAAEFVSVVGGARMGVKRVYQLNESHRIDVFFEGNGKADLQLLFASMVQKHLQDQCGKSMKRQRHYFCAKCDTAKLDSEVLFNKLMQQGAIACVICDKCDHQMPLWDAFEMKLANDEMKQIVDDLQQKKQTRLSNREKARNMTGRITSLIATAKQKCHQIPEDQDDGIDMRIEFVNDKARGCGMFLNLQLKAGNSHLIKRKGNKEIFQIKEQSWLDTWIAQRDPVMLVIATFAPLQEETGESNGEVDSVRWMEVRDLLIRESNNGIKRVTQIEFKGETMDRDSILRWRKKMLASSGS